MKKEKIMKIAAFAFVIGLLFIFVAGLRGGTEASIGDEAIDFELEDYDGNIHRLSDYEGEIVILNFFSTWCRSCEDQNASFMTFQEEFKDKMTFFSIVRSDTKRSVDKYKERTNHDLPYVFDYDLSVSEGYGVYGQPETIIIDQDGIIANHFIGPINRDLLAIELMKLER